MKNRLTRLSLALLVAASLPIVAIALIQTTTAQSKETSGHDGSEKAGQPAASHSDKSDPKGLKQINGPGGQKVFIETQLVSVTVTVTDLYGRFVTGLDKDHFEVFDDKIKQQISHFSDEDAPVSLGIVYDVSGSMKERIGRAVRALKRFIETSHDDDDFFLIGFNDRVNLVQDFTTSADRVISKLIFVAPKGSTALYDAAYMAVEKVRQGRHNKKALLIISDGQDNHSRYTYKELRNRVKESDVQIYAIGITDPASDGLAGFGRSNLEEITRMTGGRAFFPNAYNEPELVEICTRIALELRHQYGIGFYPTDGQSDAKWHKVQVKVKPPKGLGRLSLAYREGYPSFNK
jgi:Ca-activated chloride channel family protein